MIVRFPISLDVLEWLWFHFRFWGEATNTKCSFLWCRLCGYRAASLLFSFRHVGAVWKQEKPIERRRAGGRECTGLEGCLRRSLRHYKIRACHAEESHPLFCCCSTCLFCLTTPFHTSFFVSSSCLYIPSSYHDCALPTQLSKNAL